MKDGRRAGDFVVAVGINCRIKLRSALKCQQSVTVSAEGVVYFGVLQVREGKAQDGADACQLPQLLP